MPLELPPLPSDTILIVEVGSTAHGTGIPGGEDLDLIGIVVEPAEWLRAVRRGDVAIEAWWDRCLDLDAQLASLEADASIRPHADRATIERWCVDTHHRLWSR